MAQDPNKKIVDKITGVETTGHEWDGIQELNNPAPSWWLRLWLICVVFAVGYWVVYPAWPTLSGHTGGVWGWNEYQQLKDHQKEITDMRATHEGSFEKAELKQIMADSDLYEYGRAGGAVAFKNNCAACHGAGAQGGNGYPNLNDDDWIWGGSVDQIHKTVQFGVNNNNPNTHQSQMPAWGRDGQLTAEQVADVAQYVYDLHLGDKAEKTASYNKGKEVFAQNCVACHGDKGEGNQELGAPRLNDNIWLYGGSLDQIKATVYGGRQGVMPAWSERLDESTIKKLVVYVHSLGGSK